MRDRFPARPLDGSLRWSRIETDSPQARALLNRAMAAGGYDEIGELLDDMRVDRLLEQGRVKRVLAATLQVGLASEALPLGGQAFDKIDRRLRAIAVRPVRTSVLVDAKTDHPAASD